MRRVFSMKKAMAFLAIGVLAVGLAACSSPAEPGVSKDSDKTIVIWHTESNPNTVAVMDEIIASFEKKHPGYTVTQESVAWGDTQVKMQAALASGDMPELIHVEPMFVKTLYDQGLIRPLDSVLKAMPDYDKKFVDFAKQDDDGVYGLVHAWSVDYMTYRKDMYDKAGVDPNGLKTWDEWRNQLLEVGAANPGIAPVLLTGAVSHNVQEDLYMLLGSNGGSFFDKKGAPTLDTPEMKQTLQFWKSLKDTAALSPTWSSTTYPDSMALVANGEAASAFFVGRAV
jgi:ABC-type glycerol-3-phosphate transport system substrate-binding protein